MSEKKIKVYCTGCRWFKPNKYSVSNLDECVKSGVSLTHRDDGTLCVVKNSDNDCPDREEKVGLLKRIFGR